jgi:hypothetical protein
MPKTNTTTTRTVTATQSLRTLALILLAAAFSATALSQTATPTDAQKAFEALKAMPGTWDGHTPDGRPVQVTFKIVSGGSAVMSEIMGHGPQNMISVFHLDGSNKLLLTHYCSAGNQPRMQASVSPDGKTFTFNFLDVTNLAAPDAGHMQRMVLTLLDDNHHTEEWVFADHGKEIKQVFDLHRNM